MGDFFRDIIGPNSDQITWWQMSIRGILIFFIALILIRIGNKRMFGKSTAFDIALGIILGSNLSRGLTGNAPFLPVIITSAVMVGLHSLLAYITFHTSIGNLIKGKSEQLIKQGQLLRPSMAKHKITENDLEEAMRLKGKCKSLEEVEAAYLERDGSISVIAKE